MIVGREVTDNLADQLRVYKILSELGRKQKAQSNKNQIISEVAFKLKICIY